MGRDDPTKGSKSERESQIPYDITYIWNLQYTQHNEHTCEIDPQTRRADLCLPRRGVEEEEDGLEFEIRSCCLDKQQSPSV